MNNIEDCVSISRKISWYLKYKCLHNSGTTFFFQGEIGVGKTTTISNVLRCLHYLDSRSVSFSIIKEYVSRYVMFDRRKLNIYHIDLYRVSDYNELYDTIHSVQSKANNRTIAFLIEFVDKIKYLDNILKPDLICEMKFLGNGNRRTCSLLLR